MTVPTPASRSGCANAASFVPFVEMPMCSTPGMTAIVRTINVREGQPDIVTEVRLEGNFLGREDEFKSLVTIQPGDLFRAVAPLRRCAVADTPQGQD